MIDKLEQIGELDNTIIVVTSDNGMPFPSKGRCTNKISACRWQYAGRRCQGKRVVTPCKFYRLCTYFLEVGMDIHPQMSGKSILNILNR